MSSLKVRNSKFYKFYRDYLQNEHKSIIILLLLIFVGVGIANISPLLYGKIIDSATVGDLKGLTALIFLYFGVMLLSTLLGMLESFCGQAFSVRIINKVKRDLYQKIIRMKCCRLDQYEAGELMSRLNSDAEAIVDFYFDITTSILMIAFNLTVAVVFVFNISVTLSLISIAFIPLSVCSNLFFRKKFKNLNVIQKKFGDSYSSFMVSSLSNIMGLRTYQLENKSEGKYSGFLNESWKLTKKQISLGNQSGIIGSIISNSSTLVLIYFSAVHIIQGTFTIGNMVSFMTYIGRLTGAVSTLLSLNISAQNVIVSLDRIYDLQSEPDELSTDVDVAKASKSYSFGQLKIANLSFAYQEDVPLVLNDLSLEVEQNGLYSVVGTNGCGKSTLLKLLMGYYSTDSGTITIDDIKLNGIPPSILRKAIAYVPKTTYVVNDTMWNNLLIAKLDATADEMIAVCKKVGLHEQIMTFANGYDEMLEEKGTFLSSGQRQKLSMARVLLQAPRIILLDEITSDLDGEAESEIMNLIEGLSQTRIVILVSHRGNSVMRSKRIFFMEEGQIKATGTHEELIECSSSYRDLFARENNE